MSNFKQLAMKYRDIILSADRGAPEAKEKVLYLIDEVLGEEGFRTVRYYVYEEMANSGNVNAMYECALMTTDKKTTYYWLKKAADLGHIDSMIGLGMRYTKMFYEMGPNESFGVDIEKAKYWLLKAYKLGSSEAARMYGLYCCEDDSEEQLEYLSHAVKMNNWNALVDLGDYYYFHFTNKDGRLDSVAKKIYLKAEETCPGAEYLKQYGDLCYNLGNIYARKVQWEMATTKEDVENGRNAVYWLCCADYAEHECLDLVYKIVDNCRFSGFTGDYYKRICAKLDARFFGE